MSVSSDVSSDDPVARPACFA